MGRASIAIAAVGVVLGLASLAAASPPPSSRTAIGPLLASYEDTTGALTVDQVAGLDPAVFTPLADEVFSLGTFDGTYWFSFTLPPELLAGGRFLYLGPSQSLSPTLHMRPLPSCAAGAGPPPWTTARVGADDVSGMGHATLDSPYFELLDSRPCPLQCLLAIRSVLYVAITPQVLTIDALSGQFATHARVTGILYGVLVAIMLINLLIFLAGKERSHLWYVAYLCAVTAYFVVWNESFPDGLRDRPDLPFDRIKVLAGHLPILLSFVFGIQFTRSFLQLAAHAPRLDRFYRGCMAVLLVLIGLSPLADSPALNRMVDVLSLLSMSLVAIAGFVGMRRLFWPSLVYLLAFGCLEVGLVGSVLMQENLVPFSLVGFYAPQVGAAASSVLMTFAIFIQIQALRRARDAQTRALEAAHERLRRSQHKLTQLGIELSVTEDRERRRIAQYLHDEIGQDLAIVKLKHAELADVLPGSRERALLEVGDQSLVKAITDVRSLTRSLGTPAHTSADIVRAIRDRVADPLGAAAIELVLSPIGQVVPVDEARRTVLVESARELCMNVVKHARARRVEIVILYDDAYVSLMVTDDGRGFAASGLDEDIASSDRFGLFSIRERVAHFGGTLEIDSSPGRGACVAVHLPLDGATVSGTSAGG